MIKRLKNPKFILALAGLVYIILRNNNIMIEETTYRTAADIISFIATGIGVYSNFEVGDDE